MLLLSLYACFSPGTENQTQTNTTATADISSPSNPSTSRSSTKNEAALPQITATIAHTGDDVVDLCISQPVLEVGNLEPIYEETMRGPHDPALDNMTKEQVLNAEQWVEGHECAARLAGHDDAYRFLRAHGSPLSADRSSAWVAFNSFCKGSISLKCLQNQIDAFNTMQGMNISGEIAAHRMCDLTLPFDVSFSQTLQCVQNAGASAKPTEEVIHHCFAEIDRQEKADPRRAGQKIKKCFAQGLSYGGQQ